MSSRKLDDAANATAIGLVVAMVVFSVAFYFLASTVQDPPVGTLGLADQRDYQLSAEALSNTFLGNGAGWYNGQACTSAGKADASRLAPEQVGSLPTSRFGLGEEPCGRSFASARGFNNISYSKLANIYAAQTSADPDNGNVDYEEARDSLGLEVDGLDFHLRTWLIPSSVQEVISTGFRDPYMRPIYIGSYGENTLAVTHTAGVVNNVDNVILYVRITNNGQGSTVFGVAFTVPLSQGSMDFTLHTPVLANGASHNVTVTVRKTSDWDWASTPEVQYAISDPASTLHSGTINMAGVSMTYATQRNTQVVWADDHAYQLSGGTVSTKLNYASWNGKGRTTSFTDWTNLVYGPPLGLLVATNVLPNGQSGVVSPLLATTGTFTAKLYSDLPYSTLWNQDTVNVVGSMPGEFNGGLTYGPAASVVSEAQFISTLVANFNPYVYSSTYNHVTVPYAAGGDIYPDVSAVMDADLVTRLQLGDVTTLVVGSDVDHRAMRTNAARDALHDWVIAGGTLIIFGSEDRSMRMVQDLFQATVETVDEPITIVDGSHPILNVPNDVDHPSFETSYAVLYDSGHETSFTHVLSDFNGHDILAVSNNGAFGDGRIILTSWRPYVLTEDQGIDCATPFTAATNCEPLNLVHNMLMLSYRELFVDYGPLPSGNVTTGTTTRIVSIYYPPAEATVTLAMQIAVFPRGG